MAGLAAAAAITAWVVFAVVLSAPTQTVSAVHPTTTSAPSPTKPAPHTPGPAPSSLPAIVKPSPNAKPTVQPGTPVTIRADVLFQTGSADLTPGAYTRLQSLAAQILDHHVHGQIQVNGYTDNRGTPAFNETLSVDRANAVTQALRQMLPGVDVTFMPQGFGEADPVASNDTPNGQAQNRRVTIVLPKS